MAENLFVPPDATREETYQVLIPQIEALIEPEADLIANMANITAVLKEAMGFFWVGFYRRINNELVLGPFQGPLACTRIALDKGVCGACASRKKTIIVPDVEKFPGHIACSSASKSEIVVPLVVGNIVKLVLDVDSDQLDDFSEIDQRYLEEIVSLIKRRHYQ
ncbi:MAG: GAF domain-containing protein [Gemmatimonadetes bacterium]|nr:MAG: GAF domain-containing protein [Gemmatimonadota bacterium]